MLNPFFQQGARTEQNLLQDLINEQLKMYGVEVHYLPRKYVTENSIIREVVQSTFDDAYPIEAYVESFDGYGDNPTLLSKFGIQATNEITLIISKERYETYISPLIKNEQNIKLSSRPKEGDLIYFPLGDRLFEIKYVEHEKPFYQLQKNYVYELRCELFRLGDELIDTGVDNIDDVLLGDEATGVNEDGIPTLIGPSQTLTLVGTGVTAEATISLFDHGIQRFVISDRGSSYLNPPRVAISSAPSGGRIGIATARLLSGIAACSNTIANPSLGVVQEVLLIDPGAGYATTNPPSVNFFAATNDNGAGAAATSVINTGIVGLATITNPGAGYTVNPIITFTGVSTVSAAATAIVSAAGTISAIYFSNSGTGYTALPTITISDPDLTSTGSFTFNEIVTGSISGTTARVKTWNSVTNELEVYTVSGDWTVGEKIVGSSSGASHQLRVISLDPVDDGFADNINIETQADAILDFSEQNPFGIP
jgi:hypothetical protein